MSIFEMTATTDSIEVRAGESGTLELTVTNTTDRKLNRLVRIVPDNTDHSDWVSIHGDSGKNFAPGGTQKITIKFSPPVKTSSGKSKCRVLVADERNPDEDFADITLEYEIKEPKVKPKRKIKLWMWAACGVVVIIAGVLCWPGGSEEEIKSPHLKGKKLDVAISKAGELGLKLVTFEDQNSGGTWGIIKEQEPPAGDPMQPNDELTVHFYDGKKTGGKATRYLKLEGALLQSKIQMHKIPLKK